MSVEKMFMLNIVGPKSELNKVAKKVVLSNSIHPVNAIEEIDTTDFTFPTTEDNIKALEDACYIRPYSSDVDYNELSKNINRLLNIYNLREKIFITEEDLIYDIETIKALTLELQEKVSLTYNELEHLKEKRNKLNSELEHFKYIENLDVNLDDIWNLKNFTLNVIKIPRENIVKLKYNYENIPSIVLKIYADPEYSVYMVFTPNALLIESERIFKALNSEYVDVSEKRAGTPKEILDNLNEQLSVLDKEISIKQGELQEILKNNAKNLIVLEKSFELEVKASEIKNCTGVTDEFFYLCGWMPKSDIRNFEKQLGELNEKLIVIKKESNEINPNLVPPTKLKNNKFTKPFETLVNMYGIPSYKELDPTPFLAITYMLMFGIMFGDLGQGLVFVIAGYLLKYKKSRNNLGGVLMRIGVSSSIFGILYGSFFGFENVIPTVIGRPMENINKTLVYAITFGCILLISGYIFSFINAYKRKDLKEGIFGSNGLAGFLFYICFILLALNKIGKLKIQVPNAVWIVTILLLISCILFKEPLANIVQGKRPLYSEGRGEYYIESGFGILEVLLSMLSNTLSFIRVGAFAINHAGLFMAFSSIASMMNDGVGSATMYILGNIVIIGLEGLIVFIQGLRLEYYELFSKYYEGAGISYSPVGVKLNS